jgi:hypothetical protein
VRGYQCLAGTRSQLVWIREALNRRSAGTAGASPWVLHGPLPGRLKLTARG